MRKAMLPLLCVLVGMAAGAQPAVEISEAESVETADPAVEPTADATNAESDADVSMEELVAPGDLRPAPGTRIVVEYDATPLAGAAQRSIADEISIELIDLEPFTSALEGPPGRERLRLSLEECIQIALEGNPDLDVSAYDVMKTAADILSARGEFDPVLQGSGQYTYSSTTADQQLETFGGISVIESHRTIVEGSVSGKLHLGTQYTMSTRFDKEATTFGRLIDEYSGLVTMTLTQPLLRGFGRDVNLVRVRQAHNARRLTEAQFQLAVMNTTADVIRAYWELVGTVENLKVQQASLANAERLMTINETRRDIGTAADIDVLQAKAGVATRQSDLIVARARVADAGDRLKYLLGLKDNDRLSTAQIIPLDRPNLDISAIFDPTEYELSIERSVQLAMEKRPELHMSELEIINAELEVLRTRNEMLPQVDLFGSYSRGGRDRSLTQTFYGIRDEQDQTYSYGFRTSVPLGNRAARGAHQRARLNTRQSEQRLEQTRQQLMLNVYMAARNVLTNRALVESNARARSMQEVNVIAEERKLRLGTTTSFQVLQVQEELTLAQTQEVQAQIAFEQALVDLQLAQGTLLENFGVNLNAPDADTPPMGFWGSISPRWLD